MKPNVGTIDRAIRVIVGIAALAAWYFGMVEGSLGIVALVVGVMLIGTAVIRWCPPYALLGLNTGASKD
jgi:hypothetical protein